MAIDNDHTRSEQPLLLQGFTPASNVRTRQLNSQANEMKVIGKLAGRSASCLFHSKPGPSMGEPDLEQVLPEPNAHLSRSHQYFDIRITLIPLEKPCMGSPLPMDRRNK